MPLINTCFLVITLFVHMHRSISNLQQKRQIQKWLWWCTAATSSYWLIAFSAATSRESAHISRKSFPEKLSIDGRRKDNGDALRRCVTVPWQSFKQLLYRQHNISLILPREATFGCLRKLASHKCFDRGCIDSPFVPTYPPTLGYWCRPPSKCTAATITADVGAPVIANCPECLNGEKSTTTYWETLRCSLSNVGWATFHTSVAVISNKQGVAALSWTCFII